MCAVIPLLLAALLALPAPAAQKFRKMPEAEYLDRVKGAWAGKMIGVTFGAPWEFCYQRQMMPFDIADWVLGPKRLATYVDEEGKSRPGYKACATGFIRKARQIPQGCPDNDDIYINILFQHALDKYGLDVPAVKVAEEWAARIKRVWHANNQGLENIRKGILPPDSGHPRNNPHADDIDFQIEADVFGMISPGLPLFSNEIGNRMGRIMNYGDGLYGGLFVAAMYAQAFFERDPRRVVEKALAAIPARSQYAELIRDALAGYDRHPEDWTRTWQEIEDKWAGRGLCPQSQKRPEFNIDAKLNGGYIVLGLLYGRGDFYRTMNIATRAGQDNDCNPANAAGILGAMLGFRRIPPEWRDPLGDTYWNQSLAGLPEKMSITELAQTTVKLGKDAIARSGGRVKGKTLLIPVQKPRPPEILEVSFPERIAPQQSQ